jgi:hypothetical protein
MRFQSARQTLMHRCASLPATLQVRSGRRPITFGLEGSPIRCSGQAVSLGRHDTKRNRRAAGPGLLSKFMLELHNSQKVGLCRTTSVTDISHIYKPA